MAPELAAPKKDTVTRTAKDLAPATGAGWPGEAVMETGPSAVVILTARTLLDKFSVEGEEHLATLADAAVN